MKGMKSHQCIITSKIEEEDKNIDNTLLNLQSKTNRVIFIQN
jgi:hypothetical protein